MTSLTTVDAFYYEFLPNKKVGTGTDVYKAYALLCEE